MLVCFYRNEAITAGKYFTKQKITNTTAKYMFGCE